MNLDDDHFSRTVGTFDEEGVFVESEAPVISVAEEIVSDEVYDVERSVESYTHFLSERSPLSLTSLGGFVKRVRTTFEAALLEAENEAREQIRAESLTIKRNNDGGETEELLDLDMNDRKEGLLINLSPVLKKEFTRYGNFLRREIADQSKIWIHQDCLDEEDNFSLDKVCSDRKIELVKFDKKMILQIKNGVFSVHFKNISLLLEFTRRRNHDSFFDLIFGAELFTFEKTLPKCSREKIFSLWQIYENRFFLFFDFVFALRERSPHTEAFRETFNAWLKETPTKHSETKRKFVEESEGKWETLVSRYVTSEGRLKNLSDHFWRIVEIVFKVDELQAVRPAKIAKKRKSVPTTNLEMPPPSYIPTKRTRSTSLNLENLKKKRKHVSI